ncbi:hypothetical protein HF324_31125 [Chitinophaga oryzae]|uniref:Cytochrome c domain-containing protein n=1 Tax=Chitinophaga oryzae TaxID=2725414 RepID=A0ABX6LPL0_9BACT|nr:cytochrome c [Chitinophaga oryzae]QJB42058.1 hypothetical protein HF324_31125 [Chitinophaga oryzae]
MKYIICYLFICLLFACKTAGNQDWKSADFGPFKLKAPPEWKKMKLQGFDSYVGGLTNGIDTLTFDYGWYSPEVDLDSAGIYREDTINGLVALIGITEGMTTRSAELEIFLKDEKNRFFISGKDLQDLPTVLKIFKSIYFPYSDTTINPPLVMEKFHRSSSVMQGRSLYKFNCASCHHPHKQMTGPSFAEVFKYRDKEWIYRFLTNRDSIKSDSLTIAFQKRAGSVTCIRFPELTKIELTRILGYIR